MCSELLGDILEMLSFDAFRSAQKAHFHTFEKRPTHKLKPFLGNPFEKFISTGKTFDQFTIPARIACFKEQNQEC